MELKKSDLLFLLDCVCHYMRSSDLDNLDSNTLIRVLEQCVDIKYKIKDLIQCSNSLLIEIKSNDS